MALKQANTLAPSNVSATGFALADARHIGGHRVVASAAALYTLQDWQLLNPGETDTAMALGQQWYVKGVGFYRLTNWASRKAAAGWTKVVDPNTIDTTLFKIVTALPTSGIIKDKLYLVPAGKTEDKNIYAEYLYTGDPTAAYDASKWEKLGEYKPDVDLSGYAKIDSGGKIVDSQLWDATTSKHGLMTAADKTTLNTVSAATSDGSLEDVAEIGGIETGDVTIVPGMTKDVASVVYCVKTGVFAAKSSNGTYHSGWDKAAKYGYLDSNGYRKPSAGKLYNYTSTGLLKNAACGLYRWNGKSMEKVGEVDTALSSSSTNAIANSTVKAELDKKVNAADLEVLTNTEIDAMF